ncbi:hypothetical protein [Micromonospora sp. NPDC005161]
MEFLLPGAATLASGLWLTASLSLVGADSTRWITQVTSPVGTGSLQAIVALLVLLGTSYAIGVVVVMGTFLWPTNFLIQNARISRLEKLRRLEDTAAGPNREQPTVSYLRHLFKPNPKGPAEDPRGQAEQTNAVSDSVRVNWWTDPSRWWRQLFSPPPELPLDLQLALTVARRDMSQAAQSEYEYRRSVRQICVGIAPAVVIATAAAEVWAWSIDGRSPFWSLLMGLLCLAAGALVISGLMTGAKYQETTAQWLLLDLAFLHYWANVSPVEALSALPEPRAHTLES